MKKLAVIFVFALSFTPAARAQVAPDLLQAAHLIYNVEFAQSQGLIEKHISLHPHDAAGYLLRGIANEWRQYALNKGDSLNATIMEDYQNARRLALEAQEQDVSSVDKKILLATAYVYVAKKQIDTGHAGQAALSLKKAKNLMLEVLAVDAKNPNAAFAIGLFNYFADNVPSGFKWLANLLGYKGDRVLGIAQLKQAATANTLTQGDAQFMLLYILSRKERNYSGALVYAQKLLQRYPNNPVFLFNVAEMQFHTKQIVSARESFNKFFSFCEQNKGGCSQNFLYLANYFMTWSYIDERNYARAKPYLEKSQTLDTKRYKDRTADLAKWSELVN